MGILETGRPGWKGSLALLAKMALSATLMAFLFSRVPVRSLAGSLRQADWRWLGLAFSVLLASNVLGAYQWWRLLGAVGTRIPFWKVCTYYHVGLFFNNFLPAGIGGDIARVVDASRYGPTRGAAI